MVTKPENVKSKESPAWEKDAFTQDVSKLKRREVKANFVKIEELPNRTVIGKYLGSPGQQRFVKDGKEQFVDRHAVELRDGTEIEFLGTVQLDSKLKKVQEGELVEIILTGNTTKTSAGNRLKEWMVNVLE